MAQNKQQPHEDEDGWEEDEEEETEEIDEQAYNLRMFGIMPALPVPDGPPDWDAGPPDSAEEYLRRVRAEAAALPQVVRVEFDEAAVAAKRQQQQQQPQSVRQPWQQQGSAQQHQEGDQSHTEGDDHTDVTPEPPLVQVDMAALQGHHEDMETDATGSDVDVDDAGYRLHGDSRQGQVPASQAPASQPQASGIKQQQQQPPQQHKQPQQPAAGRPRQAAYVGRLLQMVNVPDAPAWALPSHKWVRQFVCDFRALREWLALMAEQHAHELSSTHVPHINNLAAWESICSTPLPQEDPSLGGTSPSPSKEEGQGGGSSEGAQEDVGGGSGMERIHGPLLRTVLCLDQVSVGVLLQRLITQLQAAAALGPVPAQWLFALAAVQQKPAHSDVVSAMRSLTRKIAHLRSTLANSSDPQLPLLNTLAAVAGAYFGQDPALVGVVSDLELP